MKQQFNLQPCRASRQAIWDFAEELNKKLNFQPGDDMEHIIQLLGGTINRKNVIDSHEFFNSTSLTVSGPSNFSIDMPPWRSLPIDRFTLAHELGHYFLHSNSGKKSIIARRYVDENDLSEKEANWFASGFLMPGSIFKKEYENTFGCISTLEIRFIVSRNAIQARIKALKLTKI